MVEVPLKFYDGNLEIMFSFREVILKDCKLILNWRVKDRVANFLKTDIEYNITKQKKWIKETYLNLKYYHWIILYNNIPIGLIYTSILL